MAQHLKTTKYGSRNLKSVGPKIRNHLPSNIKSQKFYITLNAYKVLGRICYSVVTIEDHFPLFLQGLTIISFY